MAKFEPVKTILPDGTERVVMVDTEKSKKSKKLTSNQDDNE